MKIIELTKEQEEKWLSDIKEDRIEFIHRLYQNLILNEGMFKLKLSNKLIEKLFFTYHETFDDKNEYKEYFYEIIDEKSIKFDDLSYIFNMLYLNDFKLNNIKPSQMYLDIIKENHIILDLDNIYGRDLSYLTIKNVRIKGSFDNFYVYRTDIIYNKDIFGNRIKINPQNFLKRHMELCIIKGVEFTGSFDGCNIEGIILEDNTNTIINPQKVINKDLSSSTIKDAKFTETLDGCSISGMKLEHVENAYLHISSFPKNEVLYFNNIKIYITNDDDLEIFEKQVGYSSTANNYNGATIVCCLKHRDIIKRHLSGLYDRVKFDSLESSFDNDIASVFGNISNNNSLEIPKDSIEESNPVKQKKKSIFDRLRRR